jgi:hypothetical protein
MIPIATTSAAITIAAIPTTSRIPGVRNSPRMLVRIPDLGKSGIHRSLSETGVAETRNRRVTSYAGAF